MSKAVALVLVALSALAVFARPASADRRDREAEERDPWAKSRPEDLRIQLATFGAGDSIHQYFGHDAMVVLDTERGLEAMYNFGMFGFGPDMLPKYLKGKLDFWGAVTPVEDTYRNYIAHNRTVRVVELNLEPERRMRLAQRLAFFVLPENRVYRYDHYRDNCATKLRDLLDEALDGELKAQSLGPARHTYRGHTARYTEHDPFVNLLLTLWMNDSMERPIRVYDQAFLPGELEHLVLHSHHRNAQGVTEPLARGNGYTLFEARRAKIPEVPSTLWPSALGIGALVGVLALALGLWLARTGSRLARVALGVLHMIVGTVLGVPALVAGLFLLTEWEVTHHNESLWFANPLSVLGLVIGPAFIFGSQRARRWLGYASLTLAASSALLIVLKALPMFDQMTALPMALYTPINFGFAGAHALLFAAARRAQSSPAAQPIAAITAQ